MKKILHAVQTLHRKRKLLPILVIGAFLILLLSNFLFFSLYQKAKEDAKKYPLVFGSESSSMINKISKLIALPADEEPQIATISDINKVKDQPFFAKAKNGDVILIYARSKKAILYDPAANKILEVGPLVMPTNPREQVAPTADLQSSTPTAPASSPPSPTPVVTIPPVSPTQKPILKVVLYNGTTFAGITDKVGKTLVDKVPSATVMERAYAAKNDYSNTVIIDLNGNLKQEVQEIASIIPAKVSPLPSGEKKPEGADILIIVGKDKK